MPSDNVTPFRRPKPVRPQQQGGLGFKTHRGKAVLVHLLTIATYTCAFLFPFPAPPGAPLVLVIASCVSLALAFAVIALATPNRYGAMPWATTHHELAIRTLIIGFVLWTLASALTYISPALMVVAFWGHVIIMIWAILRAIIGLVLGVMRKAIPNPRGWFV
ncbi:hypothetical protein [Candidatus Viadribacter manganicus]|uniref:Uncharacterized protein n=1 Tax=Candidatus Viadribacter manganicus TaxID=1759059 RepID=A0A1B1AJZ4_9PROT|nr:hypothetical protein [Candidatus Viadribacter manganicus]ANP46888.1 hypothetical protein ATE48_13670 [Candidatus Viadribacter manganicus]